MNPHYAASLSQKDIAKQLGVSVGTLRRLAYERLAGVKEATVELRNNFAIRTQAQTGQC